jgi:hypothetical protein
MKDTIQVSGISAVTTTTTDEVRQQRDELLLAARYLGAVTNADEATQAASTMSDIRALTRTVEASRTEVKAPVLALGKQIDALAAELTAELEAEAKRLGQLIGTFQTEERRKHEAAARTAWQAEQDVLHAARKAAADAERAAALSAAPAPVIAEKVEAIQTKAFEEVATIRAAVAVAPVIAGMSTRKVQHYEITDPAAAYAANPMFFTLTPNVAAIKAVLKSQPNATFPGLKHWTENVANLNGRAMQ